MGHTDTVGTAANIRAELARRRISIRALSAALNWSVSTTARRLNGSSPFTVDELLAVARYLEMEPAALLPVVAA